MATTPDPQAGATTNLNYRQMLIMYIVAAQFMHEGIPEGTDNYRADRNVWIVDRAIRIADYIAQREMDSPVHVPIPMPPIPKEGSGV